jgi:poly(hydroxyalkanoate) depolymerase family esterase
MNSMNHTMQQAMRLMRAGDLAEATRALQRRLAGIDHAAAPTAAPAAASPLQRAANTMAAANCIDGEFVVVDHGAPDPTPRSHHADGADRPFVQHRFKCGIGALDYKLYLPATAHSGRAPLLLMLHGCTQSPDDFALGTRMNIHAREHGYVVAYPQQSTTRNRNRCWNWFRGSDQQREHGEPAMLAALTRDLVERHGIDARRVYVAGLSAGGAMAAVLAHTHSDIYAAIGVHSGLPIGLAHDMSSAFAAMRSGPPTSPRTDAGAPRARVPAIVFHGDADTTVHPRNGEGVIDQSIGATHAGTAADGTVSIERGISAGGRHFTRTVHRHGDRVRAEHWISHGAAHAWSGGDPTGSHTDPGGPDASAQMLRFFGECANPA